MLMISSEYFGFIGRILHIDLTSEDYNFIPLNKEYSADFLGGAGYCCRYLYDKLNKSTDPLSADNILMIMTGPLSLTGAPSFGRFVVCSKSPYTNIWGESNCGGFLGPELKKAGFDGIIIEGRADKPVFLMINNDHIEIRDASHYWGAGNKEVQKKIKDETGLKKGRTLSIGPAGENLVKFASINSEGRSAGRTGMGAVMGSKNLKAIIVRGTEYQPKIANKDEFKKVIKKTIKFVLNQNATIALRVLGTSGSVIAAHSLGDLPIKYWAQGEWEKVFEISGEKLKENHLIKTKSCHSCSIGCGRIIKIDGGKSIYADCEGPEYETIAGFGSMILNDDLNSISIANNLCNNWGLDTISTSGVIALLYHLYNKGVITKKDVDNLELNWGNSESMLRLIKKIAFREGIGDLLAEGSVATGKFFKIPESQIAAVNNLEPPYHDIRAFYGLALTYAFSPRGACHMAGDVYKVLRKGNEIDFSSMGMKKIDFDSNKKEMAYYSAKVHDYRALYSSLISCAFSNPPPEYVAEFLTYLFDIPYDLEVLQKIGERIFNLKRLFNIKMGLTAENDTIPEILLIPKKDGAVKGKTPNFKKLRKYYYEVRDWDEKTGIPSEKKLKELGLIELSR